MSSMKLCYCILIALLLVLFTPNLLTNYPILRNLFTDKINYVLIMLLVIFVLLIDLYCGIALMLVILYIVIYVNNTTTKNNVIIPVPSNTLPSAIKIMPINDNIVNHNIIANFIQDDANKHFSSSIPNNPNDPSSHKVKFSEDKMVINIPSNNSLNSESEFTYNNTKTFPNKNIKPFQPQNNMNDMNENNNANNVNFVQETINSQSKVDMITQVGEPDRSGFDISGCRYDMKNSPQNLTKYGPPLSQCSAYDTNKAKSCGTIFYPLNG